MLKGKFLKWKQNSVSVSRKKSFFEVFFSKDTLKNTMNTAQMQNNTTYYKSRTPKTKDVLNIPTKYNFDYIYSTYYWPIVAIIIFAVFYWYNKITPLVQPKYQRIPEPMYQETPLHDNSEIGFQPVQTKVQRFEPYYEDDYLYGKEEPSQYHNDNNYSFNNTDLDIDNSHVEITQPKFNFNRPERPLNPTVV